MSATIINLIIQLIAGAVIFSTMVLWSVFLTLSLIRKWINAIQR